MFRNAFDAWWHAGRISLALTPNPLLAGTCVVAWGLADQALVDCYLLQMDPQLTKFFKDGAGLPADASPTEFMQAVEAHLGQYDCVGERTEPTVLINRDKVII